MPVLPLLFICFSQSRPLRVSNPIRCNRRNLSQPCSAPLQRFAVCKSAGSPEARCAARKPYSISAASFLSAKSGRPVPTGMFSVKLPQNVLSSSLPLPLFSRCSKHSTGICILSILCPKLLFAKFSIPMQKSPYSFDFSSGIHYNECSTFHISENREKDV